MNKGQTLEFEGQLWKVDRVTVGGGYEVCRVYPYDAAGPMRNPQTVTSAPVPDWRVIVVPR